MIGLGLVFLLEVVTQRIYREEELGEFARGAFTLGIPTLATEGEMRRTSRIRVLETMAASLLCVAVPVLTAFTYYKS